MKENTQQLDFGQFPMFFLVLCVRGCRNVCVFSLFFSVDFCLSAVLFSNLLLTLLFSFSQTLLSLSRSPFSFFLFPRLLSRFPSCVCVIFLIFSFTLALTLHIFFPFASPSHFPLFLPLPFPLLIVSSHPHLFCISFPLFPSPSLLSSCYTQIIFVTCVPGSPYACPCLQPSTVSQQMSFVMHYVPSGVEGM